METVVVTHHPSLAVYIKENFLAYRDDVRFIQHATEDDVKDKDVIGFLPVRLAAITARYREVLLNIPKKYRGLEYRDKELTLEELKECDPRLVEYKVKPVYF